MTPAPQHVIYTAAYTDPTLPAGYVSEPSADPTTPPPHLTGGAVDPTLTQRGRPLALGTSFDEFHPLAAAALEGTCVVAAQLRRVLSTAMRAAGFVALTTEWRHYERGTRRWAAVLGRDPLYGPATPSR